MDCLFSFNRKVLDKKLALSDDDFEAWMVSLQLPFVVRVLPFGGGGVDAFYWDERGEG